MNIKVYTSEKVKDKNHLAAINEYDKRLSRYCKITLVDCKDTDSIEKKLNRNSYIIRFSTTGSQISSEEFAGKISELGIRGNSDISIVLSEKFIESEEHLSISTMEMSMGMTTTLMFEQIYRAFRIINNHAYHK